MENEIKVGEYVRTKKTGILFKTTEYWVGEYEKEPEIYTDIKKHSFNIIDLIEVGDYVNGKEVAEIGKDKTLYYNTDGSQLFTIAGISEDIKSIVTKEQFESISYKVERNNIC